MHLVAEHSDVLYYKEQTHWDESSDHLMVRNARYEWAKRIAAKVARRNSKVVIEEYINDVFDDELFNLLQLWIAYIQWYDLYLFEQAIGPLLNTYGCSGQGYCNICDGKE